MRYSIRLLNASPGEHSDRRWFASTRNEVRRLTYTTDIELDISEDGWLEFWSSANEKPSKVVKQQSRIEVFVGAPREQAAPNLTVLHITDLHLECSRRSGPVLGREEFGDIHSPIAIEYDLHNAAALADADGTLDLIIATGDLTDHGTDSEYLAVRQLLKRSRWPILAIPGNHDHYGELYSKDLRRNDAVDVMALADTTRFERHIGPRWWARLLGDGILVGLDWFSWRLGLDRDEQLRWLRSLSHVFKGVKNILLATHDEFDEKDWSELIEGVRPHRVNTLLSGHWHISRVFGERGYTGFSTGSLSCGGLHLGPPEARILKFSEKLELESVTTLLGDIDGWRKMGASITTVGAGNLDSGSQASGWSSDLGALIHRSNVVVRGGVALVGGAFSNKPGGVLAWLAMNTGEKRLELSLRSGCVGPMQSGFDGTRHLCVIALVDGSIVGVDWSGVILWEMRRRNPALRYSQVGVVVAGDRVVGGDGHSVDCIRLADGGTVWSSGPFGSPENLISYGSPVVVGEKVVIPLGGPKVGLICFDLWTGDVIWKEDGGRGIPASSLAIEGQLGYVLRSKGDVECFDITTGSIIWSTFLKVDLGAPAPIIDGDSLVVVTTNGFGGRFNKSNGNLTEIFKIPAAIGRLGPYRNCSSFITGVCSVGDAILATCANGWVMASATEGLDQWSVVSDSNVLTTSAAQVLDKRNIILLGFEGKVVLTQTS